jgi:hypothetical protein
VHAVTLALLTLLATMAWSVTMTSSAFAFHPLFLTASGKALSFTGTSKLTLFRAQVFGIIGTIDCEKGASSGVALSKATLALKVELEYSGKCEQTVGSTKTSCTEPIKFKLTFIELGLLTSSKKVALLLAPESGTEFVKITCGGNTSTVEGAVVAEFPETNAVGEKQYNTSRSSLELVLKSENKNENQAITSIELSGVSMTKVEPKVSGFFGGKASVESTQTISFDSGVLICTTSPSACGVASGGKEPTTLTTTLSGEGKEAAELTVLEGSKARDKATLSGKNAGTATGKVKYAVYSDSKCEKLVTAAGEVTVTSGSVPASSEEELEAGKTYYWRATYEGDTNNSSSTSTCGSEILNVKAKITLTTKLSGESKEAEELTVLEGAKVKDKATLSGTNSSTAGGKVTYKIYSDSKCETLYKNAGEVTVTSGSVPASNEEEPAGGKRYYWQAHYSGDSLHQESTGTCGKEILNVQAPTTLSTSLTGETQTGEEITVVQDASVSDAATISGTAASSATGTVKYDVYSDWECKDLVAAAGEATVSGASVPSSSGKTFAPGTYYWQAAYSGDKLNAPSTSACHAEVEVVTHELTSTLTAEGNSSPQLEILEGSAVKDAATLHGEHASSATGTVKYAIYSDSECKTLVKAAGEVAVSGASVPASSEETLSPGTYYWQASYSGDAHNPATEGECGEEVVVVTTATSLSTSLSGEGKSGAEIEVKEGSAVHDTATLSGTNATTAGGYIEYNVYSDSECKNLVTQAGSGNVSSGSVPKSSEETLPVGTYYWQAVYSGDGVNHSTISTCGAEVSVVTTPITTSLSGGGQTGAEIEAEEGKSVTDKATLHGEHASIATGTVDYDVYSDSKCEKLVTKAGEVSVSGASVPASEAETLSPGIYYWQADYSGDANNAPAKSACRATVAVVASTLAQYAALGDSFSSGEGTNRFYGNTAVARNECHRSPVAYPVRLAQARFPGLWPELGEEAGVFAPEPTFIFRACSGGTTANIWNVGQYDEWVGGAVNQWIATPAQASWLYVGGPPIAPNERITLVTLTIGGNDAGFATIGRNCYTVPGLVENREACMEVIKEWETGEAGTPDTLVPGLGIPSLNIGIPRALKAIHEAAPNARIRVPLYPEILNTAIMPWIELRAFGAVIENPIRRAVSVAVALQRFQRSLNETITTVVNNWAETEGADAAVIPNTVKAFTGHRLGDDEPWVNGIVLRGLSFGESLHPTCQGQLAVARAMLGPLELNEPEVWTC